MIKANYFILITLLVVILSPLFLNAEESIFPSDYDIEYTYEVNSLILNLDDTLVITRIINNNEFFSLTGLYFSENVPLGINLESYTLTKNGMNLSNNYEIYLNSIYPGFNTMYWIIDDPDGSVENQINHNDTLILTISLTCSTSGIYNFPLHTFSFFGNTNAFFSFGDFYSVDYECCLIRGDINYDNIGPDVSDITYLVDYIFKGGEAPPCLKSADSNNDSNVLVDDLTYLVDYIFKGGPPPAPC